MADNLEHEIELEPAFHQIDLMEVVWHGHYADFLERARGALLARLDYGYRQMRESGYAWPVIELHIRYAQPLTLGQRVRIRTRIVEWENRLKINYEIRDVATGRRLTKAHTVHVAVELATGTMCYVSPPVLWEKLGVKPA